ncbi:hypothetical protein P9112_008593 [Eukaryota sp. TZLM1-RC]
MLFFLFSTSDCNLRCTYCGNRPIEDLMPAKPTVSIDSLTRFIKTSPDNENTIVFYGGEPLLNTSFVRSVMDTMTTRFVLQTNGTLLHKLDTPYLSRLDAILVSIDGIKDVVDQWRGNFTYDKVMKQVLSLRSRGFTGDLIARMTISKDADIYRDVMHLLDHSAGFDHIHWQIDCQWDSPMEEIRPDFKEWVEEYNKGITRLMEVWIERMKKGVVCGIVPFLGIVRTLLTNVDYSTVGLQCGIGHSSFTIGTRGNVLGCPVSWEDDWNMIGMIDQLDCNQLREKLHLSEPCTSCADLPVCGGRCLYANKTKWWGMEGFDMVCSTVRHLISECKRVLPVINDLIEQGVVSEEVFHYDACNNSMEVIP